MSAEVVTTVSCNGNVLINVGPTKYGTILPIFEERLRQLGEWLRINGEAIYASQTFFHQNDSVTPGVWYTTKSTSDNSHGSYLYATVLEYPYENNSLDIYPWKPEQIYKLTINNIEYRPHETPMEAESIVLLGMEDTKLQVCTYGFLNGYQMLNLNLIHLKVYRFKLIKL